MGCKKIILFTNGRNKFKGRLNLVKKQLERSIQLNQNRFLDHKI